MAKKQRKKSRKKAKNVVDVVGPYKIRVPKFAPAKRSGMSYPVYFPMQSSASDPNGSWGGAMDSGAGDGGGMAGESIEAPTISDVTYDYSAVMLELPPSELLYEWTTQNIPEDSLYIDQSIGIEGYNTDYHVTLLYGVKGKDPVEAYEIIKNFGPVQMMGSRIKVFRKRMYDVVVLEVKSEDLIRINNELAANLDHVRFFDDFTAHITLAYVQNGECDHLNGDDFFVGKKFTSDTFSFSSKTGKMYKIRV